MADYQVGNLQIAFKAIDETSASFSTLAENLRAIRKVITDIGKADLKPFLNNIRQIEQEFTPILDKINGATEGLTAFNGIVQKIGVKNISKAVQEIENVQKATDNANNSIENLNGTIDEGTNGATELASAYIGIAETQSRVEIVANRLNRALRTHTYDRVTNELYKLSSQWKNLYATMQNSGRYDRLTDGLFSSAAQRRLQELSEEYKTTKTAVENTREAFKKMTMTEQELVIYEYELQNTKRQQRIAFLEASLALGTAGKNTKAYRKELEKLRAEQEKSNKTTKKSTSNFSKLWKQIKRIALYRTIRAALKATSSAFTQSIQEFAKVDDSINNMMTSITSSFTVIKLSAGTILMPILQAITPVVNEIAVAFANMANTISQAMSTTGTYTKINAEALQDYREQLENTSNNLLDFDKFRSLTSGTDTSIFLSTEEVDEENEAVKETQQTIANIKTTITELWNVIKSGWTVIKPIAEKALEILWQGILPTLSTIFGWVAKVIFKMDELGLIEPMLYGILGVLTVIVGTKIITGITTLIKSFNLWYLAIAAVFTAISLISNWDNFTRETKIAITVISSLIAVLTAAAVAAMALNGALTVGVAVPLITTAVAAGAVAITGAIKGYEAGGSPQTGTLFYAGEAGAETVTVGSSGKTEVTNVSQMEEALYNALVRYSRVANSSSSVTQINIDGQKIFEATRKTANRQGLDFAKK